MSCANISQKFYQLSLHCILLIYYFFVFLGCCECGGGGLDIIALCQTRLQPQNQPPNCRRTVTNYSTPCRNCLSKLQLFLEASSLPAVEVSVSRNRKTHPSAQKRIRTLSLPVCQSFCLLLSQLGMVIQGCVVAEKEREIHLNKMKCVHNS